MKYKILGFLIIIAIIAAFVFYFKRNDFYKGQKVSPSASVSASVEANQTPVLVVSPTPTSAEESVAPSPENSPAASNAPSPSPHLKILKIDVDDSGAGLYESVAVKGTTVQLTFNVMADNVLSGGLQFKAAGFDSGPILPGQSKTFTFTAEQSMTFTPYGINPSTPKPYTIRLIVKSIVE